MTTEGIRGAVVVSVGDRLDEAALTEIPEHLTTGPTAIVLDLTEVSFLDSAGLSLLVREHSRCADHGVPLRVVTDTAVVTRPIELTGLHRLLEIHPTISSATPAE